MRNQEKMDLVFKTIATSSKTVRTSGKWESQITNTGNQGNQTFDRTVHMPALGAATPLAHAC